MNRIVASTSVVAIVFVASIAKAEEPFTQDTAQVAVQLGAGFDMDDSNNQVHDLNDYGFLLGARAGYTLKPRIYVGGLFDFFFGDSEETSVLGVRTDRETIYSWVLQGEVGYDIGLTDSIVIRPKAGIGVMHWRDNYCLTPPVISEQCNADSSTDFSFAPGVELPISLGGVFIAPELRFNISDSSGFIVDVDLGATF